MGKRQSESLCRGKAPASGNVSDDHGIVEEMCVVHRKEIARS
jgi:hypothetical protein